MHPADIKTENRFFGRVGRAALALTVKLVLALTMVAAGANAQVPGSFDTTPFPAFASGTGKISSLPIGSGGGFGTAVAIQPDGKIVLAGFCLGVSNYDFCVARLNADGSLDASFVGPGGTGDGRFLLPMGAGDDYARAVAIRSDGKIVLAGECSNGSNYDFCVARLNANGTLDTGFTGPSGSSGGKFLLPIAAGDDFARAIALQPDGKTVLAGDCSNGSDADFCVVRLNTNGTLDASFTGPGGTGAGSFLLPIGGGDDRATAVALQSDGKLVVGGSCSNGSFSAFCSARLNTNGSLDATYRGPLATGDGRFLVRIAPSGAQPFFPCEVTGTVVQPDGKILLGGNCDYGSNNDFALVRLNADGAFDVRLEGGSGTNGGTDAGTVLLRVGSSRDRARAIALQSDGKILLAGYCDAGLGLDSFCVARFNDNGALDTSFDGPNGTSNGKFLLPIGNNADVANAMALQSNGKIVVMGGCHNTIVGANNFCVARLNGGSSAAKQCSPDVDGDGLMTAGVDGLIFMRAMLGVQGPSIIAGISNFPANAKRNTWPQIRDYLVSQCGFTLSP